MNNTDKDCPKCGEKMQTDGKVFIDCQCPSCGVCQEYSVVPHLDRIIELEAENQRLCREIEALRQS